MSNNLGNVAGMVISANPPLEADGVTEKRYVFWAKPVGQAFDLRYYNHTVGEWLSTNPSSIINDDVNSPSITQVLSKSKVLSLISGVLTQSSVVDALTSTAASNPLSANQGRILKGLIDDLYTLLASDDTTLDELQEVVDFIKANKSTLDNLAISNIAGLQTALNTLQTNIDNLTKADVGLGSVLNYGVASQVEAEAGTSNAKYMTPLRVKNYVDKQVGTDDPLAAYTNEL